MTKLKLLFLGMAFLYGGCTFAQYGQYHSKWYYKVSTGFSTPLNRYTPVGRTDFLIEYSDAAQYCHFISATFWATKKWGLEFSYAIHTSRRLRQQDELFENSLAKDYGAQFFITPYSEFGDESRLFGGSFARAWIGVVYRIETPKLLLLPKIAYGETLIAANQRSMLLKEKDSNSLFTLQYHGNSYPYDSQPTFNTGITGLYRLSKKFLLALDVQYTNMKLNLEYEEHLRNVFTEEVVTTPLTYNDSLHTLTFGLGLVYEVRYFSRN